ncbi:CRISPR-associated helicase Cas3', partial [Methanosphaera sp. WGK6]|uniref:CRISPR-associated helicase Cas3' n=1 Tax=Methanosphaera sp. WGK6 TaxID=1561964 RepID=UPI00086BFC1A
DFYLNYNISIDEFINSFENVIKEIKKDLRNISKEKDTKHYMMLLLLFSVLIDGDKLDASGTDEYSRPSINSDIVDTYKKDKFTNFNDLNKIREDAYQELIGGCDDVDLNNKIFSITLPTGSGKTLGALSFAMKLREKINNSYGFTPRIIYSLPFLSIIDQNEQVIKDVLLKSNYNTSDIFLKHNSMSEYNYTISDDEEIRELSPDHAKMLIESWYSEIIITTFYQLFYTLFSNKNRSLKKFHNITNSIIILDEIQSIPAKYWELIRIIFNKISAEFNIWIIFMTATQPAIFKLNEIVPLIINEEKYFDYFNRINYVFRKEPIMLNEFNEELINVIEDNPNKDIMIVLNTIQSSLDVYNYINEYLQEGIELYYLSTNIIPKHRLSRIKKIKNSNNRKLIITTQLIEAGVDIDVDIIYRDFTVIDSIVQTAGRCNRNAKKNKGIVNIVKLTNDNGKKYCDYIYDSTLLRLTEELINDYSSNIISEKEFNKNIIKKYYEELSTRKSNDNSVFNDIENMNFANIMRNFNLIDHNFEKQDVFIEVDETASQIWQKYERICSDKMNSYERRSEFKNIRNQLRNYMISVPCKKLGTTPLEKNMFYISQEDLERKYDIETGFIFHDEETAYII